MSVELRSVGCDSRLYFPISILSNMARGESCLGDRRVLAACDIPKGCLVAVFGGVLLDGHALWGAEPRTSLGRVVLQVDEDAFLFSTHESPADWINHGCDPNVGFNGSVSLVSLRDISRGEEVSFDYATSDGSPYDEFRCRCGASDCRKWIRGDDWRRPELWGRYAGFFSPYLARRIERLQSGAGAAEIQPEEMSRLRSP